MIFKDKILFKSQLIRSNHRHTQQNIEYILMERLLLNLILALFQCPICAMSILSKLDFYALNYISKSLSSLNKFGHRFLVKIQAVYLSNHLHLAQRLVICQQNNCRIERKAHRLSNTFFPLCISTQTAKQSNFSRKEIKLHFPFKLTFSRTLKNCTISIKICPGWRYQTGNYLEAICAGIST